MIIIWQKDKESTRLVTDSAETLELLLYSASRGQKKPLLSAYDKQYNILAKGKIFCYRRPAAVVG